MIKWFSILLLAALALCADTMIGKYSVEYGIFGKMGTSEAKLTRAENRYEIVMTARATGLAKVLSGGRVEIYRSKGLIVDGRLVPELFSKDIRRFSKRRIKTYRFDHPHGRVTFHEERYKEGKLVSQKDETLPYYALDDIFSLYFNILDIIGDCSKPFDRHLHAVGAEKKTGKVRVRTVVGEERKDVKELLGEASCYLEVTVYQKLFGSKGGTLYLALRPDGVVTKAVLKDVVMFGDVRGRLVDFMIRP
ncbi:DUF3108 domain-containing protein [Hydrogenimonas urashimensis]|uniref:DUF3108 domain-containing protein n=1 Tax=Hydrogenimonas urashimensis TaxID=2740515 RepID=UPI00191668CE|nr:DUF3108 domain-containing protein [Hydrogenimonas urashimensis]